MAGAEGVLDGETGGLVDKGEYRVPLLVLDDPAVSHVLGPVLALVARVGGGEDEGAVADGEAAPLVGLAKHPKGGFRYRLRVLAVEAEHLRLILDVGGSLDWGSARLFCCLKRDSAGTSSVITNICHKTTMETKFELYDTDPNTITRSSSFPISIL